MSELNKKIQLLGKKLVTKNYIKSQRKNVISISENNPEIFIELLYAFVYKNESVELKTGFCSITKKEALMLEDVDFLKDIKEEQINQRVIEKYKKLCQKFNINTDIEESYGTRKLSKSKYFKTPVSKGVIFTLKEYYEEILKNNQKLKKEYHKYIQKMLPQHNMEEMAPKLEQLKQKFAK